ncbi:hypothetical protein EKO27_g5593 [Xylaria grammica]|uniref:AttH domain-containing protein n=1 Tax=Xylaria grammica TaxID=363999 RepID=A0A439D528_9PEZI|nr:hypothetical protein EKO27_g5593 [Xylaria grammica]
MKLTIPVSLLLATLPSQHGIAAQTGQVPIDNLIGDSWGRSDFVAGDGTNTECIVSRSTAFEQVVGPVDFSDSATHHLEEPRLSKLNSTVWEQWEFDGTASDGMSGIVLGFSRDASYAFFGQGNLRVEFYMILDDGTVIQDLDYVDESIITGCAAHITGIWRSKTRNYGFRVSRDMSRAEAWWETRRSKGRLSIDSDTPPGLADGSLWSSPRDGPGNPSATAELAPKLYMSHPIAGGRAVAEHSIGNKKLSFEGRGAHSRIWAKNSWFEICDGWNAIRAFVGPYTLTYWQPVSRIRKGLRYYSALLFKDGELLVGTSGIRSNAATRTGSPDEDNVGGGWGKDYAVLTHDFSGQVTGEHRRTGSTGHYIDFVSPRLGGKKWRFLAEHKRKKFDMSMGGGLGLSGFTTRVTGGEVGGDEAPMEGFGWSEQVALPTEIKNWQIWIIYGIGFLGEWKHALFDVFHKLL